RTAPSIPTPPLRSARNRGGSPLASFERGREARGHRPRGFQRALDALFGQLEQIAAADRDLLVHLAKHTKAVLELPIRLVERRACEPEPRAAALLGRCRRRVRAIRCRLRCCFLLCLRRCHVSYLLETAS